MALPNNNKTKKKIFDLMFEDCTISNDTFTYFKINPYYENDQWYVEVRYGLKRELYEVVEEKSFIKFNLIHEGVSK